MSRDFAWKELPNDLFGDLLALGMTRLDGQQVITGFIFLLVEQGRDFLDHEYDLETGQGLDKDDEHLLEVFSDNGFTFLIEEDGASVDLLIPGQFSDKYHKNRKNLAAELRGIIYIYS